MINIGPASKSNATALPHTIACVLALLFAFHGQLFAAPPVADLNVLIIGSTADSGDRLGGSSDPFVPTAIATELDNILSGAGLGSVNVQVEERYGSKVATAGMLSRQTYCHNLASWFHWPYPEGVETATRWPNLRGADGTPWDYVILIGDPFTMEYMPGVYSLGVGRIGEEVAKGSAETILLMPWPAQGSGSSVAHYKELVYRAGRTGGYKVAPAALAWQSDGSQTGATHPSTRGAYICAASIYSRIWNLSASGSSYSYDDTLADLVYTTVTDNVGQTQYTGNKMNFQNSALMLGDTRRDVHFSEKGSSTEQAYKGGATGAMSRARVLYDHASYCDKYSSDTPEDDGMGWPVGNDMPIAWNHGRRPASDNKNWVANPAYWQIGFGFTYQAYWVAADNDDYLATTDEELNDYTVSLMHTDDIVNAVNNDHIDTFRGIAARTLWAGIHQAYPNERPNSDRQHMNGNGSTAGGTFMYTLYSGRCPIDPQPGSMNVGWWAQKVGYETAWMMGTCSSRAPGFKVMPSSASAQTVTPSTTETMTVQFVFPPRNDVTVEINSSDTSAAIVGTQTLVFTPTNYNVPQSITVAGVSGTTASAPFTVDYTTTSDDPAYDGLSDSWAYTTTRTPTTVIHVDNGTTQYTTPKNFPVTTNLGASGATSANTVFAGPNHGTLTWSGSDVVYTPDTDYVGPDGFAYWSLNGSTVTTGYIHIDVIDGYPDGSVRVEVTDSSATEEGQTTGTWTIIREGSTASDLTVNFTLGGSATDGIDYNLSESSPITIPSGLSAVTITLAPIDDSVFGEHTETATLTIASGTGYTPITSPATINIADNDNNPPVVNAGPDQTVSLDAGSSTPGLWYGTAAGNINLADPNPETLLITNVAAYTEDGIADNTTEIYTGRIFDADGSISFTENIDDKTRIYIDGNPVLSSDAWGDRVSTGNLNLTAGWHDIEIRISNGGGGNGPVSSPGIGFDPNGGTAWQTLVDPGDGSLLHVGTGPSVVVDLNGTVTDPEDTPATLWTLTSSTPSGLTVTFGDATAIDTTATFTAAGTYVLRLTANDGYGDVFDEVTIIVNDPGVLPEITVTATDAAAAEAGQDTGTWTINRSGDTTEPLTVNFALGGTATETTDYTIDVTSPVTIPANETSVTVTLTPVDDTVKENSETANIIITPDAAYTVGTSEDITITDDDNIPPVVDAGPNQTVPLVQGQAPGWSFSQWTSDADSGLSNSHTYSAAHCFGDNHGGSVPVNGVVFTESFNTSGTGWSVSGAKSDWNGDDNANLTGTSEDLGEEFIYNGNPRTVTLTGLTVGQAYEVTFFSVAWETGSRAQTFAVVGGDSMFINQDAYDNNNGIKISCVYVASSTSQDFTITPDSNASFHLYAMANRITSITEATATLNGDVSDADGDTPTTTWTVVSTVPAGLESTVTFADASAIDTTATFTELGVYTLRLTANDGNDTVYDECVITVGTGGGPIADVDLPAGISLYGYTGENPIDAQTAFQPLIDNSQLSQVRWVNPTNGQIKELYYTTFPSAGWVNEIGDLTLCQGYVVKTTAACTLSISGNKSTVSFNLDLPAGYSIIGFNKETPMDAQTAFQSLTDAGKLDLVRWVDPSNGQIKELYYTTFPSAGWVNEIGDLTEAQGYIIKLNAAHTGFTLP